MQPTPQLVATVTEEPTPRLLADLARRAAILELRADLVGDLPAERLREAFPGELLYTLRSSAEGGRGSSRPEERAERLAAADGWDLVDLEERDLEPGLLARLPAGKRLISWHGGAVPAMRLRERLERLTSVAARFYKLVPAASVPAEAIAPLELLRDLERDDVVAFASGEAASWSRLLAPRLGAPLVYAATGGRAGAAGQLHLDVLCDDYGLPALPAVRRLFGIVGAPVAGSLSPRLHNALYRELGIAAVYLPFEVERFGDFWLDLVESDALGQLGFDLRGLSVTTPHKEVALAVAGATSPLAERIGSANTLVRRERVWEAETTDGRGVLGPLEARGVEPAGRLAAVVGAGGASRAAAFGLARAGAEVAIVNRGAERGRRTADLLGVPFVPLDAFEPRRFDLLVNATPVGSTDDRLPFEVARLAAGTVVVDLAYRRDEPTALVAEARRRGLVAVDGREVLLHQAVAQFELMTDEPLPLVSGARLLGLDPAGPGVR